MTNTMQIYAAIDLRGGKVVRLQEGDPQRQTVFSDDPVATAQRWLDEGAQWLHVVNLDGAFGEQSPNLQILEQLVKLPVKVQFAGGLRSLDQIETVLKMGVARVFLGTIAIQAPQVVIDALTRYGGERVGVALDARNGMVATHGWQTVTDTSASALGTAMAQHGVRHALYTDVSRDGKLGGVNVTDTLALAQATGLQVIASGGVGTLEDIQALLATRGIAGVVIGMALYTGQFTLGDALTMTKG